VWALLDINILAAFSVGTSDQTPLHNDAASNTVPDIPTNYAHPLAEHPHRYATNSTMQRSTEDDIGLFQAGPCEQASLDEFFSEIAAMDFSWMPVHEDSDILSF
jgi:hypothetical protein